MTDQFDWKKAFDEARAKALNVDAYTFQIAWAYCLSQYGARDPIIESPDILERIKGANERLRDGYALMRVPVHPTDPDCVLIDAGIEIERLRAAHSKALDIALSHKKDLTR